MSEELDTHDGIAARALSRPILIARIICGALVATGLMLTAISFEIVPGAEAVSGVSSALLLAGFAFFEGLMLVFCPAILRNPVVARVGEPTAYVYLAVMCYSFASMLVALGFMGSVSYGMQWPVLAAVVPAAVAWVWYWPRLSLWQRWAKATGPS